MALSTRQALPENSRIRLAKGFFLSFIAAGMRSKFCRPASGRVRTGFRRRFSEMRFVNINSFLPTHPSTHPSNHLPLIHPFAHPPTYSFSRFFSNQPLIYLLNHSSNYLLSHLLAHLTDQSIIYLPIQSIIYLTNQLITYSFKQSPMNHSSNQLINQSTNLH